MNKCRFSGAIAAIAAVLFSVSCLSGCGEPKAAEKREPVAASTEPAQSTSPTGPEVVYLPPDAERSIGIETTPIEEKLLEFTVNTTGEVLANANLLAKVTSPVSGRVVEVLASVGQHVTEGQTLLKLRSQDIGQSESDLLSYEAQVNADLKRDLLQVDSDTSLAESHHRLSESTFKRISSLVDERIASKAEYEAAKTHHEENRILLEMLRRKRQSIISLSEERMLLQTEPIKQKLRLLGVSDVEIAHVLKSRVINPVVSVVAPETGIVSERLINMGELVDPSKPLFTIGAFNTVWLKADVYEKDIAKVKEGQPIELAVESFPNEKFAGILNYVADSVNEETRTLAVRAEVANPGLKLKPKMFARMKILVGEHRVMSLPEAALQDAGSDKVVYLSLGNGRYEERKVKVGSEADEYIEVVSGLKPGDRVVTKGSFELRSESLKDSDSRSVSGSDNRIR